MAPRGRRREAGFTYIGMIVFVTVIGLVGAATLKVGALLQRAEAEYELLEIGAEFSAALRSYAAATPRGQPPLPTSLDDLLRDPRFPAPRRHLRRIFVDPITGTMEWGIVRAGEGGRILGVHSLSQAQPLKIAGFDGRFVNFQNKKHLSEWRFTANGHAAAMPAPAAAASSAEPEVVMTPPERERAQAAPPPVAEQPVLRELAPPPKNDKEDEKEEEETPATPGEPVPEADEADKGQGEQ